ncbi:STAS domain-containing protein [Actinomadura darangshiensis]|nr:STAS domain-containing protein [Actinomadura darangshiensis]
MRHDDTAGERVSGGARISLRRTDVVRGAGSAAMLIALAGEIDASNSGWLTAQLTTTITGVSAGNAAAGYDRGELSGVILDLTGIRFCDASGIAALVKAFRHAQDRRLGLELTGAHGRVARVLQITKVDEALTLHPRLEGALAALTAPRK